MHRLKLVPYSKQTTTIHPIIVHACIKIMLSLHFWMNVSGLSLMWNLIKKLPPDLFDPNQKRQTSRKRKL